MFGSREERDGSARMQGLGLGLVIGAMLGAGAALLFAPASGEDTRRRLRRSARRAYLRGEDVLGEVWDDAEKQARRMAKRGVERGREVMGKL